MTSFTWTIEDMTRNPDDGGVVTVYWKCVATDGDNTSDASGSVSFVYDAASSAFVAYNDLTQQTVLSWLPDGLRSDTESSLTINVFEAGIPEPTNGLPW